MNEAAKMFITENITGGSLTIENIEYQFRVDFKQICIEYKGVRGRK